jgi:hypothetical protein
MAAWISDLAAPRQACRDKLEERHGLKVPSEDPDWVDLGEAAARFRGPIREDPSGSSIGGFLARPSLRDTRNLA